ncbi:TRAP transporter substrate-binding protein [Belnapia sp. T18]|uniref:TRAP transporter substrate-binding protein n=1 Tax=Belnapia arida TaxID=2804533 RepID=A0ABS1U4N6_9PROT|nr:TRAP transporter substrate-binding protein [Belnapia arida]MBL6079641.1 TRAP transporter substrate-binding protein [Belnapia arida]
MFAFDIAMKSRSIMARTRSMLLPFIGAVLLGVVPAAGEETAPIHLRIAGGLGGVTQYMQYEAPFWTTEVPRLTNGRVQAAIAPFDRSGIRGSDMLGLMRLGVVPFGTVSLSVAAGDEPELGAMDLPALNPDIATLRQSRDLLRPRLEIVLRDRYSIKLLAIYTYPAQVLFCREPFKGLADLAGRRVRVSSVGQSEMIEALNAVPVVIPFAQIPNALRDHTVECAITGSLSGNALGLQSLTSAMSRQAISWGVSFFGANLGAWAALPSEVRSQLQQGLTALEGEIWQAAERETEEGFACNAGLPQCIRGEAGRMIVLNDTPLDQRRRRQLLRDVVLPRWIERCGEDCITVWNRYMAVARGIIVAAN